jgi:hypothetical protein
MARKLYSPYFLYSPDKQMASDITQCRAVADGLTEHSLPTYATCKMALISADSSCQSENGSNLTVFSALVIFPSSDL